MAGKDKGGSKGSSGGKPPAGKPPAGGKGGPAPSGPSKKPGATPGKKKSKDEEE